MPWRETSPMEQRLDFVREYESDLFTMTELAVQYGITPKTGYKWLERFAAEGALGLCDRSRRPQPVRAALRCAAPADDRCHAVPLRTRVRRIRVARTHSQRQRRALRQSGSGRTLAALGLVDSLGHYPGTHCAGASRTKRIA